MMCPVCEEYVFENNPTECPKCHSRVILCEPCFGTGQIEFWASGLTYHGRKEMRQCTSCSGRGLVALPPDRKGA
jgi:hypothetical protein